LTFVGGDDIISKLPQARKQQSSDNLIKTLKKLKKELTNKKQSDMISELHLRDEKATKQRNDKEP